MMLLTPSEHMSLTARWAELSPAGGSLAWVLDLHREMLAGDHGAPAQRVSPMFARLANEVAEAREERDELKAYRLAYAELERDNAAEHAAIERFTRQRLALTTEDAPAVIAGFERLAEMVDAAMGD